MHSDGKGIRLRPGSFFTDPIPPQAKAFVLILIFAGWPVILYCLYHSLTQTDLRWLYLAVLTVVASCFPIKIPLTSGKTGSLSLTVSDVFVFTAILLLGPQEAATIAVIEGLISSLRVKVKRLYKQLFNLAQLALVSFLVGQIFYQLQGSPPPLDPSRATEQLTGFILAILFCGLLYFVLNSSTVAMAMALVTDQQFTELWKQNFLWASISSIAGASLAAGIFLYFKEIQFLYSIAITIPIISVLYYAYKMNRDRITETFQHLSEVNALLAEKIEAEKELQKAKEQLEIRVEERTEQLSSANLQLMVEKERLAVTLRSIGDGVITTDTEGNVLLINKIAEDITGWTQLEAMGRPLPDVFDTLDPKTRESSDSTAEQVLRTGKIIAAEPGGSIVIARDGTERTIAHSAAPICDRYKNILGVVLVFRDITDQQRIEEELLKAQKMESLGILAGGIAHDFNNVLAGILLKTQLAQRSLEKGKDPAKFLNSIEEATQMATALTQQLLTFAKGGAPIRKTTSLKELLKESASFSLRGSNVRCAFEIPDDLWPAEIDEGQISQVINNLVINADQAMPQGGTISIRAENVQVTTEQPIAELHPGGYVKVNVQDNGVGIASGDLGRIFDPYFTTKQKGSGLGLATTYSIIQKHGGHITVDSEVDKGTTFTFYLPASSTPVEESVEEEEHILRGSGRVLVMDDEEIIRDSIGELLGELGYEVDFASDGASAISLYQEALAVGNPFDAVIMDLTIPGGMGGKEAIRRLREIDPKARAIVSSGYSEDPVMADFREYGFSAVLVKPFRVDDVGRVLAEVL
ncbi:MAG TPA: ATP-binding protein [Acidobacteriota bacterium]|nr:ATP-binding protein [Acidobacteriota bacterium]